MTLLWEFRLVNGVNVYVKIASFLNDSHISKRLTKGEWFTDRNGWRINPANVLMFRKFDTS